MNWQQTTPIQNLGRYVVNMNKIKNLLGPPNGCFSVSESMSSTDRQTYRPTTRGPGGPKKALTLFIRGFLHVVDDRYNPSGT